MSPNRESFGSLAMSPDGSEAESFHRLLKNHESSPFASDTSTAYDSSDYEAQSPISKYPSHRSLLQKLLAVIYVHLAPSRLLKKTRTATQKKKLRPTAWLDGLRGYAAFQVYIFHITLFWYGGAGRGWAQTEEDWGWYRLPFIRNIYASGHADVGIFFVISGFVLTQKSLSLIRSQNFDALYSSLGSAVFRRWLRLWIPVLVSTFACMLLTYYGYPNMRAERKETFKLQFYDWYEETRNLVNPFSYRDEWETLLDNYDWATWTIPLEYYGSMICYVVTLGISRVASNTTRVVIVALLAFYSVYQGSWFTMCFLAGMLIADYDLHVTAQNLATQENLSLDPVQQQKKKHTTSGTVFWTLLFIFSNYLAGAPDHGSDSPGFRTLFSWVPETWLVEPHNWYASWAGIFMVISINRHPYIYRFFETSVAQFLAKISYALYLVHNIVYIFLMDDWLRRPIEAYFGVGRNEWGGVEVSEENPYGYEFAFATAFLFETAVTVTIAIFFERWVDAPSVKFAKSLENWVISSPKKEEEIIKERE